MSASYNILKLAPLNPILLRVVTAGGRRLRHAFTRWGYLALLIVVLLFAMLTSAAETRTSSLSDLAKAASKTFSYISYVQLGMICLLAPVFCAAAITQERDSRTYNILLATPLTNAQIVLGSLFSRLYYVVALLLSGVPVFAITLLYGGVTASSIALSFAIALSTAFFTGSLAIAIAVFRLGSGKTVFWFYVFNAIYLVALLLVDHMWLSVNAAGEHHTTWLTSIHPFLALRAVVSPTAYPTPNETALAGMNRFVRWYFANPAYAYVTLTTVASLALVIPSAIVLRRIAQRSEVGLWAYVGNILRQGKEGKTRRARNVWANPVAWREAATRAGFSGRGLIRWITIIVGLAGAGGLLYVHHMGYSTPASSPMEFTRQLLMGLIIVEFSVALLVATNTSASAVTKERESQTLDLLLVTPITSRYYIWGKLRGLVSFMLPFAAVPTFTVLLVVLYDLVAGMQYAGAGGAMMNSAGEKVAGDYSFWERALCRPWVVNFEVVIAMPVLLTAVLAWACMLGLQLSLKWSRTIVAVMASVGVLAGICAVLGVCGFTMALNVPVIGTPAAMLSPFTAICVLVNPGGPGQDGFSKDFSNPDMPLFVSRSLVFVFSLVSSGLYCLLVYWMYKSMVKNFDMIIRRQHQ
jgi:ABC-type transport system involved in multi-copper enzyme maturation permease subunit